MGGRQAAHRGQDGLRARDIEQAHEIEQGLPVDLARDEGQRRADAARFAEIGEPARQAVLERRAACIACGDRAGRRRREHRGDRGLTPAVDLAPRAVPHEEAVAQTVDDHQDDVARACQPLGRQRGEQRMPRRRAARRGQRGHQVQQTACGVVGQHVRDRAFA